MILHDSGFVGYTANQTLNFSGTDTEETFKEHLKILPDDWCYRNKPITYRYNENGHRSRPLAELNLDNYILVTGCSHTEGVGLAVEDTYPHLIADKLGCDYYNLAIGGSGIDILVHNLILWLNKVKTPPKALILQWPEPIRFSLNTLDVNRLVDPQVLSNFANNDEVAKFMILGDSIDFFNSQKRLNYELISSIYQGKIVTMGPNGKTLGVDVRPHMTDVARDCGHLGIDSNKILANQILTLL